MEKEEIRYWKIAPGKHGFLWVEQRDNSCIAIGWNRVGELKNKSKEELKKALEDAGHKSSSLAVTQLWLFQNEIRKGDKVIASSGKYVYGLGTIKGDCELDKTLTYQHMRPVSWEVKFWKPMSLDEELSSLSEEVKKKLMLNRTVLELEKKEWREIENEIHNAMRNYPFEGFTNFEGLCRAPETEQELVILFSKLSQLLKMKIVSVSTRFPDAIIRVKKNNRWISEPAEFELNSSDFQRHMKTYENNPEECKMIICWRDDWKNKPTDLKIEIVELRKKLEEII